MSEVSGHTPNANAHRYWGEYLLGFSTIGLGILSIVIFEHLPNLVFHIPGPGFDSNGELVSPDLGKVALFYLVPESLVLVLFPFSLGLVLNARRKMNRLVLVGLVLMFALPFVFLAPVFPVERSFFLQEHCYFAKVSYYEWESLSYHLSGVGVRVLPVLGILCF